MTDAKTYMSDQIQSSKHYQEFVSKKGSAKLCCSKRIAGQWKCSHMLHSITNLYWAYRHSIVWCRYMALPCRHFQMECVNSNAIAYRYIPGFWSNLYILLSTASVCGLSCADGFCARYCCKSSALSAYRCTENKHKPASRISSATSRVALR